MPETLKLLSDVPDKSRDEEFIKQIQNQLEGSVEKNTAFIGLQGKWGSGKSTLIRSLTGYTQYIFSMWSSNSQHLRRDFLVGLAEKIGLKKAAEKIALGQDLPPTNGCQKCWSRIVCYISWILFALFIFGMWVSISEVFYNLLNASPFYSEFTDAFKWVCLIGLSLLTVFIFLIYSKCDISGIFSIFGFTAAEPSADLSDMQFEKYFCQLIEQNPKTLLIVPDNVDRMLQGQDEAGICFLYLLKDIIDKYQQGEKGYAQPEQKAIILVPYDKKGLLRILEKAVYPITEKEAALNQPTPGNAGKPASYIKISPNHQALIRLFPANIVNSPKLPMEMRDYFIQKLIGAQLISGPTPIKENWALADGFFKKVYDYFSYNNTNSDSDRIWGGIAASKNNVFIDEGLYLLYNTLNTSKPENLKKNPQYSGKFQKRQPNGTNLNTLNYSEINTEQDLQQCLLNEFLDHFKDIDIELAINTYKLQIIYLVTYNRMAEQGYDINVYRDTLIYINKMIEYRYLIAPKLLSKKISETASDKILLAAAYCFNSPVGIKIYINATINRIDAYKNIQAEDIYNPAYEE